MQISHSGLHLCNDVVVVIFKNEIRKLQKDSWPQENHKLECFAALCLALLHPQPSGEKMYMKHQEMLQRRSGKKIGGDKIRWIKKILNVFFFLFNKSCLKLRELPRNLGGFFIGGVHRWTDNCTDEHPSMTTWVRPKARPKIGLHQVERKSRTEACK